jgi:hypothetical protein
VYTQNKNDDRRSNVNLNVVRGLPVIKAGITTLDKDGYYTLDSKTSRKEFSQGKDPFGHKGSVESHGAASHSNLGLKKLLQKTNVSQAVGK